MHSSKAVSYTYSDIDCFAFPSRPHESPHICKLADREVSKLYSPPSPSHPSLSIDDKPAYLEYLRSITLSILGPNELLPPLPGVIKGAPYPPRYPARCDPHAAGGSSPPTIQQQYVRDVRVDIGGGGAMGARTGTAELEIEGRDKKDAEMVIKGRTLDEMRRIRGEVGKAVLDGREWDEERRNVGRRGGWSAGEAGIMRRQEDRVGFDDIDEEDEDQSGGSGSESEEEESTSDNKALPRPLEIPIRASRPQTEDVDSSVGSPPPSYTSDAAPTSFPNSSAAGDRPPRKTGEKQQVSKHKSSSSTTTTAGDENLSPKSKSQLPRSSTSIHDPSLLEALLSAPQLQTLLRLFESELTVSGGLAPALKSSLRISAGTSGGNSSVLGMQRPSGSADSFSLASRLSSLLPSGGSLGPSSCAAAAEKLRKMGGTGQVDWGAFLEVVVFATPPTGMGYGGGGGMKGGSRTMPGKGISGGPLFGGAYIDPSVSLDFSGGRIERIIKGGGR